MTGEVSPRGYWASLATKFSRLHYPRSGRHHVVPPIWATPRPAPGADAGTSRRRCVFLLTPRRVEGGRPTSLRARRQWPSNVTPRSARAPSGSPPGSLPVASGHGLFAVLCSTGFTPRKGVCCMTALTPRYVERIFLFLSHHCGHMLDT